MCDNCGDYRLTDYATEVVKNGYFDAADVKFESVGLNPTSIEFIWIVELDSVPPLDPDNTEVYDLLHKPRWYY